MPYTHIARNYGLAKLGYALPYTGAASNEYWNELWYRLSGTDGTIHDAPGAAVLRSMTMSDFQIAFRLQLARDKEAAEIGYAVYGALGGLAVGGLLVYLLTR